MAATLTALSLAYHRAPHKSLLLQAAALPAILNEPNPISERPILIKHRQLNRHLRAAVQMS